MAAAAKTYTEEQKQAFVDRAAQIGLTPAVKELGYPTVPTASRWCSQMGVRIQLSALQAYAAATKTWYGHAEKMSLLQRLLDEAYDLLVNGEPDPEQETVTADPLTGAMVIGYQRKPCTAATISRLAATVQRVITTMELLEGRATERSEQIGPDTTDIELAEMIREYRTSNAIQEKTLRELS